MGGVDEQLAAEMAAQMAGPHDDEDSLDEASVEASMEALQDSDLEGLDVEGDADSPAAALAGGLGTRDPEEGAVPFLRTFCFLHPICIRFGRLTVSLGDALVVHLHLR